MLLAFSLMVRIVESSNPSKFSDSIYILIVVVDLGSIISCLMMCSVNSSNSFLELSDLIFAPRIICVVGLSVPLFLSLDCDLELSVPSVEIEPSTPR